MRTLSIDLSLRSTGLCFIDDSDNVFFKLITTSKDKFTDEKTLIYNWYEIWCFILEHQPTHIVIEDLSYDSISSSKDLINGNFWYIRANIVETFPDMILDIITVAEWRNPLFSKEERKQLVDDKKKTKELKRLLLTLPKEDKKLLVLENEQLILNADIKYLTYQKLSSNVKLNIESITTNKSKFDLCDAYFLNKHYKSKLS